MKVWRMSSLVAWVAVMMMGASAVAAAAPALDEATLKARASAFVGSPVTDIKPAPMAGFYEAVSSQGLFYLSADGEHMLWGKLYKITQPVADLTEESYRDLRVASFKTLEKDMIIYPAKDEKHVLTVFTDISCGYCRKFHQEIEDFNKLGFTIRYLAYPRGGEQSPVYEDMRSIWCSKDRKKAMDKAKAGGSVAKAKCEDDLVLQYETGNRIGIRGTPAVYLDDGMQVGGYVEPADLVKIIEQQRQQQTQEQR